MGKMIDKLYRHPRFGTVKVLIQPNYKAGGPRNVAIQIFETGKSTIVPQRSLRKIKAQGKAGVAQSVEQLICNQQVGGSIPSASSS